MKKKNIFYIVLVILVLILIVVMFNMGSDETSGSSPNDDSGVILKNAQKESEAADERKMKDFNNITIDVFEDYYNGNVKQVVLIGRSGCQYCEIAEPILRTIMYEKNVKISYLTVDELGEEGNERLYYLNEDYFGTFGTPFLLVVGDGDIVDMIEGLTDKSHYEEFLRVNNFIK